jgi:hypothetical protein
MAQDREQIEIKRKGDRGQEAGGRKMEKRVRNGKRFRNGRKRERE